ncbi:hypothetical protein A2662_00145 [Candidatus Giovannonibacteria bacterium RIFCSPHIGHO2_01_FULL_45_33]|uniref:Uncharacterized protein n=1 Tax=Candidatus Giovannonibacteria bacterium RIFCSPLOWO2_01_FULL_45_34 TaxID=1798351 RepID=A0A1F5X1L9_9BACT|nr:MAG: hypothetical protein A2662_00145 [Candidatus Giovannonibacteria bacterium RIFCSPHIGHO2_01_FULL_45_33]OGF70755.1 MAG: hypothetical protein A3C73_03260 [Candidatus Giovannonibacteria bacterium RIFCSPHIGHO2_02_FULL_44_11]OGF81451.1 MAG: hypothetical protein A2930_04370 [Candidatus Giovannonibacteria bacterium RIFCSPLOWO2_01_FULL_45_34]
MVNTQHLLKVSAAWISIVYTACFAGAALFSGIRTGFMMYALHMNVNMGVNVLTAGTFLSGLVIWNVITFLAVWLFAVLFNRIKK